MKTQREQELEDALRTAREALVMELRANCLYEIVSSGSCHLDVEKVIDLILAREARLREEFNHALESQILKQVFEFEALLKECDGQEGAGVRV